MADRREFITAMGAVGLTGTALLGAGCAPRASRGLDRIGVQLYTLRSAMEEDVERTLARVAEIGYTEVEFAGYFGRSPRQIRDALDQNGLSAPGVHLPLQSFEQDWEATVETAATVGHRYLVLPSIPPADRAGLDAYRSFAERFNAFGERTRAAGFTFAYHNHDFEFAAQGDRIPYDVLVEETDPALVFFELDLFWITRAGADPGAYFRDHPGRFPLVHVKDMAADGAMVDVGAGTIAFPSLFALGGQAGIRHFIVEHDDPAAPFESIAASYRYLRGLRY